MKDKQQRYKIKGVSCTAK